MSRHVLGMDTKKQARTELRNMDNCAFAPRRGSDQNRIGTTLIYQTNSEFTMQRSNLYICNHRLSYRKHQPVNRRAKLHTLPDGRTNMHSKPRRVLLLQPKNSVDMLLFDDSSTF